MDVLSDFWSNEGHPEEPIHVHVAEGKPTPNATKFWIMRNGKTLLANNNSHLKESEFALIRRIIEANAEMIKDEWLDHFETLNYYC